MSETSTTLTETHLFDRASFHAAQADLFAEKAAQASEALAQTGRPLEQVQAFASAAFAHSMACQAHSNLNYAFPPQNRSA